MWALLEKLRASYRVSCFARLDSVKDKRSLLQSAWTTIQTLGWASPCLIGYSIDFLIAFTGSNLLHSESVFLVVMILFQVLYPWQISNSECNSPQAATMGWLNLWSKCTSKHFLLNALQLLRLILVQFSRCKASILLLICTYRSMPGKSHQSCPL